jgi:hypothetical protein
LPFSSSFGTLRFGRSGDCLLRVVRPLARAAADCLFDLLAPHFAQLLSDLFGFFDGFRRAFDRLLYQTGGFDDLLKRNLFFKVRLF